MLGEEEIEILYNMMTDLIAFAGVEDFKEEELEIYNKMDDYFDAKK